MKKLSKDTHSIEKIKINEKNCLKFGFVGVLTYEQAVEICKEWENIFHFEKEKKHCIIFNALEMENYEPMARVIFQNTIKKNSNQIKKIWVITHSRIIAGGAAIMSLFTSFTIKCVSAEEQVIP